MKPRKRSEEPPSAPEAEQAVLACVLLSKSMKEVDALLEQLRPAYFYDIRYQSIFTAMVQLRMEGHAVDEITLTRWCKDNALLADADILDIGTLADKAVSWNVWPRYVPILAQKYQERRQRAGAQELAALATAETVDMAAIKAKLEELTEVHEEANKPKAPMLQMISPSQARAYVPDAQDFMLGDGLIMRGAVITIAGRKGIGKSLLTTTLAVAGARGNGTWMGYPVRCKWKTAILQTENLDNRLAKEYQAVPEKFENDIRVSNLMSHGMAFGNPEYRRMVRKFYDEWPFEMLVIDPWNNVSFETGQKDYMEALYDVQSIFMDLRKRPAIVIAAHFRKDGRDAGFQRLRGREIVDAVTGSQALSTTSRTVFGLQPASVDAKDDRVVFEIGACNDADTAWLEQYGTRSAWKKLPGAFERLQEFEWDAWDNNDPMAKVGEDRRSMDESGLRACLKPGQWLRPAQLVKLLQARCEVGEKTAFRAISFTPNKVTGEIGYLTEFLEKNSDGMLRLKNGEEA